MAFTGGGFVGNPNMFAGDQFVMPSQHDGPDSGVKKKSSRTETLRDVTVLQLLRDNDNSSSETYTVDGVELQLMTLVGRVTHSVENAGSCISYTLHDGTGSVGGLCYINDDSDEKLNKLRSDLQPGKYVRVFGVPRPDPNDGKITVQSYKIRPVTDFNEITYHNLQVIFQRLHLKQGAPPQGGMATPAMQGGMPQAPMPMGGMLAPAPAGATLYDQLNALYHSPEVVSQPQGIHINNVMSLLQQQGINCTLAQVKEAVEGLVSDGHLYSTVDDDTHRICE